VRHDGANQVQGATEGSGSSDPLGCTGGAVSRGSRSTGLGSAKLRSSVAGIAQPQLAHRQQEGCTGEVFIGTGVEQARLGVEEVARQIEHICGAALLDHCAVIGALRRRDRRFQLPDRRAQRVAGLGVYNYTKSRAELCWPMLPTIGEALCPISF